MKKWYDPLECDNIVENPFIADTVVLKGVEEFELVRGQLIEKWDKSAWFQASEPKYDGDPDDVLQNAISPPIYSARLRKALDNAGVTGIQYLPVHVLRPDGSPIEGFAIANILNLLPALDFEKSDYDVFEDDYFLPERRGKVRCIRKPVLRRTIIEGYDIFRLMEFKQYIIVSDRFRNIFVANGFTGYSFHQVYTS
ncbi:hypothetical protein L7E55_02495 [Pelotomaculum isophthalicicum JI]|uniref:Immunity MXAN-0049 protein domain-containing protein n=1 Tax=Pelotomaculum isophthalicicum JI TaxID=947010 RepID=A0A9X4H6Z5_9FIRM|nr:DUF1629 domain-containing protein [Pelotomaculum isophthalicicum]MDF9407234.1 hypothetical protein [Pelotomaculum isophthalicicum JI]